MNNDCALVYDPDTDRFIYMSSDAADLTNTSTTQHTPFSRVITVGSGKAITAGTAQRMNSNLHIDQHPPTSHGFGVPIYDTVSDKVLVPVVFNDYGTMPQGWWLCRGTVTGGTTNTISWENPYRISPTSGSNDTPSSSRHNYAAIGTVSSVRYYVLTFISDIAPNKGDGIAYIGEVDQSTGALTVNSTRQVYDNDAQETQGPVVCFDESAGKFVFLFSKGASSYGDRDPHLIVGTPSGTGASSELSFGTAVEVGTDNMYMSEGRSGFATYDSDIARNIFIYGYNSRIQAQLVTVSGTTPSVVATASSNQIVNGSIDGGGISVTKNTELSNSTTVIYEVLVKLSNEIIMVNLEITASNIDYTNTAGARKFDVVGTSNSYHKVNGIAHGSSTSTDNSCGILAMFSDGDANQYGSFTNDQGHRTSDERGRSTAVFRQTDVSFSTNLTTENYIGISNAAYSDGNTATIQIAGSVDDAQSSLTIGQIYYVKPTGGLDRVQGLPKVVAGVATSASTLAIAGPPTDPQHDPRIFMGSIDYRREKDENGNSMHASTFMIPANIPASEVVAYQIEVHNIAINGSTDNIYVYCQPLASDGSTSVMSNTWHAVNSYTLDTSYSDVAYNFTSSTGLPCMLGGKNYGLISDTSDSVPQVDNTTDDIMPGLYSKCIYTQSRRYGTWNWDATWHGHSDATGGLVSLDNGHASADGDASTTGYAHGFKFYAASSAGTADTSSRFIQGMIRVYAIVKSDLDRSGVSATGGNEDLGG